jgi:hypothetical protein
MEIFHFILTASAVTFRLLSAAALLYVCVRLTKYTQYVLARSRHGCKDPIKYPHKDPILGLDYWFEQRRAAQESRWLPTSKALFSRFGKTYEINNLGQRMIHTMDVKNIQHVWATDFRNWGLQPLREGIAEPFFGHGLNTTDGELWKHSRALVRPTFNRTEIANLNLLGGHVDRLLQQLPVDESTVDLQPLFSRLVCHTVRKTPKSTPLKVNRSSMPPRNSSSVNRWARCCQNHQKTARTLLGRSITVCTDSGLASGLGPYASCIVTRNGSSVLE